MIESIAATEFRALVVRKTGGGEVLREVCRKRIGDLPAGEVLIRVEYSSLNYKDALSASGSPGITRNYPHTPGIDAAGTVVRSDSQAFLAGSPVIVSGYDLGVNTPGGFGEYIRVPAEWVMPVPQNLSLRECMIYGTAGFTAALSVQRLVELGIAPEAGNVVVTGASGGVGSFAVALLARAGYSVTAATAKTDAAGYLRALGAEEITPRTAVQDATDSPLLSRKWAAAVDTVGGEILATVLRSVREGGIVTCCGNAASPDLILTVYPFIIRGVTLCGIDSAGCPMPTRKKIWDRLAGEWKINQLSTIAGECSLEQLSGQIDRILAGQITGRIVVNLGE